MDPFVKETVADIGRGMREMVEGATRDVRAKAERNFRTLEEVQAHVRRLDAMYASVMDPHQAPKPRKLQADMRRRLVNSFLDFMETLEDAYA